MTSSAPSDASAPAGHPLRVRVVGNGRAGGSLAGALRSAGVEVDVIGGRSDEVATAGAGVDVVLICVPDGAVAGVAAVIEPSDAVVAHVSGSLGLDVLAGHERTAGLHPLVALPDAEAGAARLASGATFAVAGEPVVAALVDHVGGRAIEVDDRERALYHAAAVIASNHLVGLLGQAERVANSIGIPLDAYLDLVRVTVDNVADLGPAAALTGPVARGDETTIQRHLDALPEDERDGYRAMVEMCRRLVEQRDREI